MLWKLYLVCIFCCGFVLFPKDGAADYTRKFLLLYSTPSKSTKDGGEVAWTIKPEFHLMAAMGEIFGFRGGWPKFVLVLHGRGFRR